VPALKTHMWRIAMWSDDQIKAMDMYLWLDFSIEVLWGWYMEQYMGNTQTTVEDEVIILRTMGLVYDLETQIIDLIDATQITFSMIDKYKEENSVRSWPTRFS
jgi:transposase